MAIVISCDRNDFVNAFERYNRMDNFSREGLEVLFDYLEEVSGDDNLELDVVALCCEYNEGTIQEIIKDYNIDLSDADEDDPSSIIEVVREYLQDNTSVCGETADGFVYACF